MKPIARRTKMRKLKILSVFGTRPEAIKMAPLVRCLEDSEELNSFVCVTGQHREMLDTVLDVFAIKPDFDLDIMQEGQTLYEISSRILLSVKPVFDKLEPDLVLVHGDTSSSFCAALSAFYSKIPVGHVEAGLRSFDTYSPFPEEMNRRLTARLASLHFAPTALNRSNLIAESVPEKNIFVCGNTVVDSLVAISKMNCPVSSKDLKKILETKKRLVCVTCHRRENYGKPMENIFTAIVRLAVDHPELHFVYPVHPAPAVRKTAEKFLGERNNIHLIEPLNTIDMQRLMSESLFIMSDSGGLQEEGPALKKPVLLLRRETERPEAISAGTVALAGTEIEPIYKLASKLLGDREFYESFLSAENPYGDGFASKRIRDAILFSFGLKRDRTPDFPEPYK